MHAQATAQALKTTLKLASRIAGHHATLPVLTHVLLKTDEQQITISATDLEMGLVVHVPGKIITPGAFCVPARLMSEFVESLPDEPVDMELQGTTLRIATSTTKATCNGMVADDFPIIPLITQDKLTQVDAHELRAALVNTLFSCATDDARPELAGVFWQFTESTLTLAATDSSRLSEVTLATKQSVTDSKTAIVPQHACQEIIALLDQAEEPVDIYLTDNQIMITSNGFTFVSRLVEAQFPQYKQIIPRGSDIEVVVPVKSLIDAVKTSGLFSRQGAQDVQITPDSAKKELLVESQAAQVGTESSVVAVSSFSGKGNEPVVFNYRFLLDGLAHVEGDDVVVGLSLSGGPGVIKNIAHDRYTYIVMPIRRE